MSVPVWVWSAELEGEETIGFIQWEEMVYSFILSFIFVCFVWFVVLEQTQNGFFQSFVPKQVTESNWIDHRGREQWNLSQVCFALKEGKTND